MQPALSGLGLSSLGRSEARVLTALDALLATLARLAGLPPTPYPGAAAMADGPAALRAAQEELFGPDSAGGPPTRIMMGILPSEAAEDPVLIQGLVEAAWAAMVAHVRAANAALGRQCRVLMDIAGPKCRIEEVRAPDGLRLHRGDRFVLAGEMGQAAIGDSVVATLSFAEVVESLRRRMCR